MIVLILLKNWNFSAPATSSPDEEFVFHEALDIGNVVKYRLSAKFNFGSVEKY